MSDCGQTRTARTHLRTHSRPQLAPKELPRSDDGRKSPLLFPLAAVTSGRRANHIQDIIISAALNCTARGTYHQWGRQLYCTNFITSEADLMGVSTCTSSGLQPWKLSRMKFSSIEDCRRRFFQTGADRKFRCDLVREYPCKVGVRALQWPRMLVTTQCADSKRRFKAFIPASNESRRFVCGARFAGDSAGSRANGCVTN